jgi:hypothetical protein
VIARNSSFTYKGRLGGDDPVALYTGG